MRSWVPLLALLVACGEAEGSTPDDDDSGSGSDGDADADGSEAGSDTGMPGCTDVVQDGSFEDGPFGEAWAQGSAAFDTVICDSSCVEGPALAHAGFHWVFFGGQAIADSAFVSQTVPIVGSSATLSFYLKIETALTEMPTDSFTVLIDGENLLTLDNTRSADYAEYTRVDLDISQFAGAESHLLSFDANFTGNNVTSIFLDSVELQACD